MSLYLTMNRFQVRSGREADFEAVWAQRDSHLKSVPGFVAFHLMKGEEKEGYTLYASHTTWASEDAFRDWTRSEAFRRAHAGAGSHSDIYQGHPQLETFTSIQSLD